MKKGKKEKSLYQRLRELPLSKDRVGQSFIIVRGGHVGKPGNGDGGGGDIVELCEYRVVIVSLSPS